MKELYVLNDYEKVRLRPGVLYGSNCKAGAISSIKRIVALLLNGCEHVKVSCAQGKIYIKASGLDTHTRWAWRKTDRDTAGLLLRDGSLNEYFMFKSVCENLVILNDVGANTDGTHTVELTDYSEGLENESSVREAAIDEYDCIHISFTPSHEVFKYDTITKEDLNFISIE